MIKIVLALQLATMSAVIAILAFLPGGGGDVEAKKAPASREEVEAGKAPESPELAALREEVRGLHADNQNLLKGLRLLAQDFQNLRDDFDFMQVDVDGIKRNTWDVMKALKASGQISDKVEVPESYQKLFNPETRQALVKKAAEKGVVLKEDRIEIPSVIVQNRAMLEFFAVITGGKVHESIVALTGNYDPEKDRLPEGLAGVINACILSLGYKQGTPVSATPDGKMVPPQGMPIHLYLEWKGADGKPVRARAEDLIYDLATKKPMQRDKWVYIGSRFVKDWGGPGTAYMADLTGDIVATYSSPNTMIDNTTLEAKDDVYYVCYAPRIPAIGTKVTMVISKQALPAKDFPPGGMEEDAPSDGGSGK